MEIIGLLIGAIAISVLHAALPNHWLPFVLVGRAQKWDDRKILRISFLAGTGHVVMTGVLGLIAALVGSLILSSLDLLLLPITSGILIVIGLIYVVLGYRSKKADAEGHHHHVPDNATSLSLFLMLTFSPCEAMIPVFFSAGFYGFESFLFLVIVVSLVTIGAIMLLVYLTMKGYDRIHSHWLERNDRIVVGAALILLGILVYVFHLMGI
jgi:NADH:ubiquinone oxidoreductase subunit 6 (subunit J)